MRVIKGGGVFSRQNVLDLNANFGQLFGAITPGNLIYCDPSTAVMAPHDGSVSNPYQALADAYGAARPGMNDVIVLVGNGASNGTARVDASFTWAKDATHLVGACSPVMVSQRARIAPTSTTTAFTPYFTVSGSGCLFQNIQWFMSFTTGTTSQIGMVVSGSRNYFGNCHIAGMGDAASAQSAGSRSLKVTGGENLWEDCTIGLDTVTRTAANASLEFASGAARNGFRNCWFPFQTSSATVLGVLGTGAACIDRFTMFDNCTFFNGIKSTSTAMTVLVSLTNASPGGLLLFKQCCLVGITDYGDTIGLANSYIDGFTGAAATSGIAVNPS